MTIMCDFSVNPQHTHPNEAQRLQAKIDSAMMKSARGERIKDIPEVKLNTEGFTQNVNDLLEELRAESEIRPEILQKFQNSAIFDPLSDAELSELAEKLIAEEIV